MMARTLNQNKLIFIYISSDINYSPGAEWTVDSSNPIENTAVDKLKKDLFVVILEIEIFIPINM